MFKCMSLFINEPLDDSYLIFMDMIITWQSIPIPLSLRMTEHVYSVGLIIDKLSSASISWREVRHWLIITVWYRSVY